MNDPENSNVIVTDSKELTRVPNPFVNSYQTIEQSFGIQSILITDLMIFLANGQLKNIFGDITFDVDTFCKKMGYTRANLQRKLSEEDKKLIYATGQSLPVYQNITGTHTIENYIETALWHATQKRLMLQKNYHPKDNSKTVTTGFIGVTLLEGFDINSDFSSKKRTKKTYTVRLGSGIKDYLLTEYNLIELKDYRNIPNITGFKLFYLYLCRIRILLQYKKQKSEDPIFDVSVDALAKVFDYQFAEPKDRKKAIKNTLDKINNYLAIGKFGYQFTGTGRAKYIVRFTFSNEVIEYFDEKTKAYFFNQLYQAISSEYVGKIHPEIPIRERAKVFEEILTTFSYDKQLTEREKFWEWFYSEDDRNIKEHIYNKVYYDIFKLTPDDPYSQNIFVDK